MLQGVPINMRMRNNFFLSFDLGNFQAWAKEICIIKIYTVKYLKRKVFLHSFRSEKPIK